MQTTEERARAGNLNCVNQTPDDIVTIKEKFLAGLRGSGSETWQKNPLGILPRTTASGSVTQDRFLDLAIHFCDSIPTHLQGKAQILLVDGHVSRWSLAAIRYCMARKVFLFYLPSHTSIWSQPNDNGANIRWHTILERVIKKYRRGGDNGTGPRKGSIEYFNLCFVEA